MNRHSGIVNRRTYLSVAGASIAAIAGCLRDGEESPSDDGTPTPSGDDAGEGAAPESDADGEEAPSGDTEESDAVHDGYETTTVTARSAEGEQLGSVTAAIADTPELRYLGLSDTPELPSDCGMLFVFDDVDDRTFVMREMSFGIDIVYADADGTITEIHHAPAPGPDEDGSEQRYPGRGQYVLEVVLDWTTEHGVNEGDVLAFDRPG